MAATENLMAMQTGLFGNLQNTVPTMPEGFRAGRRQVKISCLPCRSSYNLIIGKAIGGVIVFASGLPLYAPNGKTVGGLGLSGDTSCADHVIIWKIRHELQLDAVPTDLAPSTMTT
jgi:hypothetical protein